VCATGEEPLTIAMALDEAGWLGRAPIEIRASDASTAAIEKARRGVYRERSFRNLPAHLRDKYFTQEGATKTWRVDANLHAAVEWRVVNLMKEAEVAPLAAAHVIFCRNVFIYFSDETIRKTVRSFAGYIRPPGYLFVAAAESLLKLSSDFELQEVGKAFVYVRRPDAG
jgi:chemotaxis protein methyltransferase CheR